MSELAAATKAPPPDTPNDDEVRRSGVEDREREAGVAAVCAECGSRRSQEHQRAEDARGAGQEPSTKVSAKMARAWSRIADRTMKKAAEEFAKRSGREAAREAGGDRTGRASGATHPRRVVALKRRLDLRAQLRRHLRLDAEPGLPRRDALVQQHAEPRHRAVAAFARRLDQRRLARIVDDVVDQRRSSAACRGAGRARPGRSCPGWWR